jgi:hypothetical protein
MTTFTPLKSIPLPNKSVAISTHVFPSRNFSTAASLWMKTNVPRLVTYAPALVKKLPLFYIKQILC